MKQKITHVLKNVKLETFDYVTKNERKLKACNCMHVHIIYKSGNSLVFDILTYWLNPI